VRTDKSFALGHEILRLRGRKPGCTTSIPIASAA
jgi:hypothetical protein